MAPTFRNRLAVLTLAAALCAVTVTPVFADDASSSQSTQADTVKSIGSVSIGSNSSLELKNASVLSGDGGKVVTFTVTVHNDSDSEIQFIDYWVRLLASGGTQFTVNVMADDKNKNKVPAHSSMDVGFYANVNSETNLSDLTFRFIKWDFDAADYERNMGEISIPSDYSNVTPLGQTKRFDVSGTSMDSTVSRLVVNKNDDYYLATAYLNLENVGMKKADLDAAKYVYAIQTPEGYMYSLAKSSSTSLALAPRVKQELSLNASIPTAVSPDGWKLLIIDASNDPNLPVATFELPSATAGDTSSAPSDTTTIDVGGTPVGAFIKRVSVGKTDTNYMTNVYFTFQNNGVKTVSLTGYQFALVTKDGLNYPLTSQTDLTKGSVSLNPLSSRDVQLSVNIPKSVDISGMQLQLIQSGTSDQFDYPIATFQVPAATTSDVSVGVENPFTDSVGTYAAKLNAIQRTPLDDNDILSADLSLANKGDALLPLPSMQAYFLLDGNVKINATLSPLDNVNSITVNSSVHYSASAIIPYTTSFSTIKLVLQEKDDNSGATPTYSTVAEFKNSADLLQMPVIAKGNSYNIADIGKQAEVKPTLVQTYTGPLDTNLYYVELQMTNLEKRFTDLADLKAYLKTKDDMYFPATITSVSSPVSPKAKATVALWAKLPKDYAMADLDVVLGEAQKVAGKDAYVRAVDMKLPDENTAANSSYSNMNIGGYTVSMSNVKTTPGANAFNLSFDYTLAKSNAQLPELPADTQHKFVVVVSSANGSSLEKNIDLVTASVTGNPTLSLGTANKSVTYSTSADPMFLANALQAGSYTLNIYDDFGGYRKLLGSNTFTWFN